MRFVEFADEAGFLPFLDDGPSGEEAALKAYRGG
jgi:hypothetical protein